MLSLNFSLQTGLQLCSGRSLAGVSGTTCCSSIADKQPCNPLSHNIWNKSERFINAGIQFGVLSIKWWLECFSCFSLCYSSSGCAGLWQDPQWPCHCWVSSPCTQRSVTTAGLWFDTIRALLLPPERDILFGLTVSAICLTEFHWKYFLWLSNIGCLGIWLFVVCNLLSGQEKLRLQACPCVQSIGVWHKDRAGWRLPVLGDGWSVCSPPLMITVFHSGGFKASLKGHMLWRAPILAVIWLMTP